MWIGYKNQTGRSYVDALQTLFWCSPFLTKTSTWVNHFKENSLDRQHYKTEFDCTYDIDAFFEVNPSYYREVGKFERIKILVQSANTGMKKIYYEKELTLEEILQIFENSDDVTVFTFSGTTDNIQMSIKNE